MKRRLALILAVVLVLSLSLCQLASAEAPKYPIVDEPITVTCLVVGRDTSVSKDRNVWQKMEEVTGINIEYEFIDEEALTTYLVGNEWPDFFICNMGATLLNDYGVIGGRFADSLDYLAYMPNLQKTFEDYPTVKAVYTMANGEMYELPSVSEATTIVYPRPLYRKDLAEKAGWSEVPATVDELKQLLVDVKELTGEYPFIPDYNNELVKWPACLYAAFGTGHCLFMDADEDGNVYFVRTCEQYKHYLEYMNELYELGVIHPEAATFSKDVTIEHELGGNILLIQQGESKLTEAYFESGVVELAGIPPLTSEYDDTRTYINRSPVITNKNGPVVNADSEYVVEIMKMLDIMHATEEVVEGSGLLGQAFTYGLQNVDWHFTETGYVQTTPEGSAANTYLYAEAIWDNQGRADLFGNFVSEVPGNNQVRQQAFLDAVKAYETDYDFVFESLKFTEEEQYVIDNTKADITAFYRSKHVEFVTGVSDIDTDWEAYCAEFEKMRIDELVAIYQAAYDRFMDAIQ